MHQCKQNPKFLLTKICDWIRTGPNSPPSPSIQSKDPKNARRGREKNGFIRYSLKHAHTTCGYFRIQSSIYLPSGPPPPHVHHHIISYRPHIIRLQPPIPSLPPSLPLSQKKKKASFARIPPIPENPQPIHDAEVESQALNQPPPSAVATSLHFHSRKRKGRSHSAGTTCPYLALVREETLLWVSCFESSSVVGRGAWDLPMSGIRWG